VRKGHRREREGVMCPCSTEVYVIPANINGNSWDFSHPNKFDPSFSLNKISSGLQVPNAFCYISKLPLIYIYILQAEMFG